MSEQSPSEVAVSLETPWPKCVWQILLSVSLMLCLTPLGRFLMMFGAALCNTGHGDGKLGEQLIFGGVTLQALAGCCIIWFVISACRTGFNRPWIWIVSLCVLVTVLVESISLWQLIAEFS